MNNYKILIFLFSLLFGFSSCVDQEFDTPPSDFPDPNLKATITIKDLKNLHALGRIDSIKLKDAIVRAVVIADDRSGNYYQSIIVQDSTAGMELLLNAGTLFATYPVGREVFIKASGLLMADYNEQLQLGIGLIVENGNTSLNPIPSGLIDQYVIPGARNQPLNPIKLTVPQLNSTHISRLVQIEDVEVAGTDTTFTYADPIAKSSGNRRFQDCSRNALIVRSSGYASFAGTKVPTKKGTLTGVYGVFGRDKQIFIRDTSDVQFRSLRCGQTGGGGGGGTGNEILINISDIKSIYNGTATPAPANRKISGIVISDRATSHINAFNLVLQQGDGLPGIVVRFTGAHSFNLGDRLEVVVSGIEISEFRRLLQLNNVPFANAKTIGTGASITPRIATIDEINANFEAWESTLVQINGPGTITKTSGTTWSGNTNVVVGGSSLLCFTPFSATPPNTPATFANANFPATFSRFVGYLGQFTTSADVTAGRQIQIRNPTTDVTP
jgi:hypothetical protein